MNNLETLGIYGTVRRRRKKTHNTQNYKIEQHGHHQQFGEEHKCSRKVKSSCFL